MYNEKKIIFTFFIICLLILTNADNNNKFKKNKKLKIIKDEVDQLYFKENFGFAYLNFEKCSEYELENIKINSRKYIIENTELTENEKSNIIEKLKKIKYDSDKYFAFIIFSKQPFLKSELNFSFEIKDKKDNLYLDDIIPCFYKITATGKSALTNTIKQVESYYYIWIIKSNIQLNEDNINIDNLPIEISIIFPNGEKRIFEYK